MALLHCNGMLSLCCVLTLHNIPDKTCAKKKNFALIFWGERMHHKLCKSAAKENYFGEEKV